jgi:hypothetical protein
MLEETGPSAGVSPPRVYIQSPAQEAYNPQIIDPHFRTPIQIRGLAYRTGGDHTPPLTLDELVALRGLSRATILKHLAALRAWGSIQTEPAGEHAFVIHLLPRKPGQAARAEREVTLPGDCDDGTAGTAEKHHVATFPLRWGSGATTPAHERGDATQAKPEDLPQPGRNGHGANGAKLAGAYDGA